MFAAVVRVQRAIAPQTSSVFPALVRFFADNSTIHKGTVKWFDVTKGFGFVVPDDGTPDVFVHQTAIFKDGFRSLAEGEPVEYKLTTKGNGRTQAVEVTGPNGAYVKGTAPKEFEY
jgi:cold shock CspA family protein